jgi:hypothetical protein
MNTDELGIRDLGAARGMEAPSLRRAIVIRADLGPALEFATAHGTIRAVFPIIGGEARGRAWRGRILPGGADFALALPDGSYAIEARYCLELHDGTPVMITNAGRMVRQPDGSYEGRTRAALEVPDGPTGRLATRSISVPRWPRRAMTTTSMSSFGKPRSRPSSGPADGHVTSPQAIELIRGGRGLNPVGADSVKVLPRSRRGGRRRSLQRSCCLRYSVLFRGVLYRRTTR